MPAERTERLLNRNIETVCEELIVDIRTDLDIVAARQKSRELAGKIGFPYIDLTIIATAVSELARNIVLYAGNGTIYLRHIENSYRRGSVVVAEDRGPGIADVHRALQDGFSTSGSLGMGLPGTKRLMDDFEIASKPGQGTRVTVKKWKQ